MGPTAVGASLLRAWRSSSSAGYVLPAVLALNMIVLAAPAISAATTCLGQTATIIGTDADEKIRGTPAPDVIHGGGGHDVIRGLGGADRLCGGTGRDKLLGGAGNDRLKDNTPWNGGDVPQLYGGRGDDALRGVSARLYGGGGNDYLEGRLLNGGPGDDVMQSNRINVWIFYKNAPRPIRLNLQRGVASGWGRDILRGPISNVYGSRFDDRLIGDRVATSFAGLRGNDVIRGRGGRDQLVGSDVHSDHRREHDRLFGGAGPDGIYGRRGRDHLDGGSGDDALFGGPGVDSCVRGEEVSYCEE